MACTLCALDPASGALLGYASVCICQPQAVLPPPFPSTQPHRLYLDGLVVAREHRQRGVGLQLLCAAERLGGCEQAGRRAGAWVRAARCAVCMAAVGA